MQISVIGCGHVGLVTGACFATIGHQVICVDRDAERIRSLQQGSLPVFESHLSDLILRSLSTGAINFTTELTASLRGSAAVFLCIGVPLLENGDSDFAALDSAAGQIARVVDSSKLIVVRSTVPVRTGEQLKHLLCVTTPNPLARFQVAANPQFLREGTAVEGFLHPARVLLGVEDPESESTLRRIYAPIIQQDFQCPIHRRNCPYRTPPELLITTVQSAELIEQVSNAYFAMKISYANVLADLCERLGGNVQEVTHAMGLDPRINPYFLYAGIGFGGDRLPKDLRAFCKLLRTEGLDAGIPEAAETVNLQRIDAFFQKTQRSLWVLKGKKLGLLGLSHKPNTNDIRDSPAIQLAKRLSTAGAHIAAFDPQALSDARASFPEFNYCPDPYIAADRADALLLLTEWEEFRRLDWQRIRNQMARPLVLDGRNFLSPAQMKSLGFEYISVGRPA